MSKPYTAAQLLAMSDEELAAFTDRQLEAEAVRATLDELEREVGEGDCSPIVESPEASIDYGEGICDERFRVLRLIHEARERA